jgi:hypothetical protein
MKGRRSLLTSALLVDVAALNVHVVAVADVVVA